MQRCKGELRLEGGGQACSYALGKMSRLVALCTEVRKPTFGLCLVSWFKIKLEQVCQDYRWITFGSCLHPGKVLNRLEATCLK